MWLWKKMKGNLWRGKNTLIKKIRGFERAVTLKFMASRLPDRKMAGMAGIAETRAETKCIFELSTKSGFVCPVTRRGASSSWWNLFRRIRLEMGSRLKLATPRASRTRTTKIKEMSSAEVGGGSRVPPIRCPARGPPWSTADCACPLPPKDSCV